MATLRERILDYLRLHPIAADDDQLAIALGVRRQAINIACRGLVHEVQSCAITTAIITS